ncbi:hypothetical protein [Aristophania vespae]|uniref:hypothetical protein n=1 Tax=Aristophania vespae TaxID=2697033 RepID=UPI0023510F23|nr:hypothetical protein [Aristophania vespae]UMM64030.1 hypothetical protein DM15PD_10110 [Aristophania vespae]
MINDKEFYDWYQDPFAPMSDSDSSLTFLFGHLSAPLNDPYNPTYSKKWAQKCLDVMYRLVICSLVDATDTANERLKIKKESIYFLNKNFLFLEKLANSSLTDKNGYHIWLLEGFELTDKGIAFMNECNLDTASNEVCPEFKKRLITLFDEHDVGFNKSNFIPIQF